MKCTILGAGSPTYQLPYTKNTHLPAYLLEDGEDCILFECTENMVTRLSEISVPLSRLSTVAITHVHLDHFQLPALVLSLFCTKIAGGQISDILTVYAPQEVIRAYYAIMDLQVPDRKGRGFEYPQITFVPVSDSNNRTGSLTLMSKPVYHGNGAVESVAYRVEKQGKIVAYSGDCGMCEGIKTIARDADLFLCDSSVQIGDFSSSSKYGHFNPFEVGIVCKEAGVKRVVLVHYAGYDLPEAMITECKRSGFTGEVICGQDYMTYEV